MLYALQCFIKSYFKTFYIIVHIFCNIANVFFNSGLGLSGPIYFILYQARFSAILMNIFMGTSISRTCCIQELIMADCSMKLQEALNSQYFYLSILILLLVNRILWSKFSNLVLLIWTIVYLSVCSLNSTL